MSLLPSLLGVSMSDCLNVVRAKDTNMYREAADGANVVERQLHANEQKLSELRKHLAEGSPSVVFTCARGSSDHAATYGKYLFEKHLGLPTLSYAPSVGSVYDRTLKWQSALCIAISQSGASPDILDGVRRAKDSGVYTIATVNDETSPLAAIADFTLPMHAGAETSVAATKSFIASVVALASIVASLSDDEILMSDLKQLPQKLHQAWQLDWGEATAGLLDARNMFVVGRGVGLGVAQEAALKFKECCGVHAEAFSAAEVLHGPMALADGQLPFLILGQKDEGQDSIHKVVQNARINGCPVFAAIPDDEGALPFENTHSSLQPILLIQSFYKMICELAVQRGYDPDTPPLLRKITKTV